MSYDHCSTQTSKFNTWQNSHIFHLGLSFACGPVLLVIFLLSLATIPPGKEALAQVTMARYVAPAPTGDDFGNDCAASTVPCATIQHAVDVAAPGDEIRVATGTYTGVQLREGVTQVVYISKTVIIHGGYTTAFTDPPDPHNNPVTLDARGYGRVFYITGDISATLEGLRITGGNAAGLGGPPWEQDAGGGAYLREATVTISDCAIYNNTASTVGPGFGGGIFLSGGTATLSGNAVYNNTASTTENGRGGGLYLLFGNATLNNNTITANAAQDGGGGLSISGKARLILITNIISANTASLGGGLSMYNYSEATVISNTFCSNTAGAGGGLYLYYSDAVIRGNLIFSNTVRTSGGGLGIGEGSHAVLSNNTIISNVADKYGGGIFQMHSGATLNNNTIMFNSRSGLALRFSGATLNHNTVAFNHGSGVYLWDGSVTLNGNTISSNHGSGLSAREGRRVRLNNNIISFNQYRGVSLGSKVATLDRNTVFSNSGGGLSLSYCDATLTNNFIIDNALSSGHGSGLSANNSSLQLHHNTIAGNRGGEGEGIYITNSNSRRPSPQLRNNIVAYHDLGIHVEGDIGIQPEGTLWWENGTDWTGNVTTGTTNVWEDPYFVNPDEGDYHLGDASAAIDAGLYPTLNEDVDGDTRPMAFGSDIGADEFPGPGLQLHHHAWQQTRDPGQTVTYTLVITGAGTEPVNDVVMVDVLPLEQRATSYETSAGTCDTLLASTWGGQIRCMLGTLNVGDRAYISITAQVTTTLPSALPHQMRNHAWVTGSQASNTVYADVLLQDCHVRLNDGVTEWNDVQAAVDASTELSDVVKIAGVCTGVNTRYNRQQVVYVDKTVTIRGGYNPANWSTPDPAANPTRLDAYGQGGVLYVGTRWSTKDNITPTLEGLRIAHGLTTDDGGGIYVTNAQPIIRDCWIFSNTTYANGGGMYQENNGSTLKNTVIMSNTAHDTGGGLYLYRGDATLINSVIADNQADVRGSGLYLHTSSSHLLHSTIARNGGGDGSGVFITNSYYDTTTLTNTILVSQATGIVANGSSTTTLNGVLWYSNTVNHSGNGPLIATNEYTSNPAFTADGYHLTALSAALDMGVDTGVNDDIDGGPRPVGHGFDLGADEVQIGLNVSKQADPDPVLTGKPLTYTLYVTNTHNIVLNAAITDTLPDHVSPGGARTWSVEIPAVGTWTKPVFVTVEMGYVGLLTNVVQVTTEEGATGVYTHTVAVLPDVDFTIYLPVVLRDPFHDKDQ